MTNKIKISILALIAVSIVLYAFFGPYNSKIINLDFIITDSNNNYQYEINESLKFSLTDSTLVNDRSTIWFMGNGDSIIKSGNVDYRFKDEGKYLVSLKVDDRFLVSKKISVVAPSIQQAKDSITKIHGVNQGYVGEELVFFTEGEGINTWYWEFGETGTVDAYEKQVVYKYTKEGKYRVKLQTNTLEYPKFHYIEILPRFEKIKELEKLDSVQIVGEDIRKRLQSIADSKSSNGANFLRNLKYIKNNYICDIENVSVVINGGKYDDLYSYCHSLHYLENSEHKVVITEVKVDTVACIEKIKITQSSIK